MANELNMYLLIFRAALDIVGYMLIIVAKEACCLLVFKRLENGLTKIIYFDKVVFVFRVLSDKYCVLIKEVM